MNFFDRAGYPLKYFLLDIIGCVFVLPSALKMAGNIDVFPTFLQFNNNEWWLMALGLLFVTPGIIFMLKKQWNEK